MDGESKNMPINKGKDFMKENYLNVFFALKDERRCL
jgi:hypothetical protein